MNNNTSPITSTALAPRAFPAWAVAIAATLFAGAIASAVTFQSIGSTVLADGTLSEPFFLIPMGWLFAVLGVGTLLAGVLLRRR